MRGKLKETYLTSNQINFFNEIKQTTGIPLESSIKDDSSFVRICIVLFLKS